MKKVKMSKLTNVCGQKKPQRTWSLHTFEPGSGGDEERLIRLDPVGCGWMQLDQVGCGVNPPSHLSCQEGHAGMSPSSNTSVCGDASAGTWSWFWSGGALIQGQGCAGELWQPEPSENLQRSKQSSSSLFWASSLGHSGHLHRVIT